MISPVLFAEKVNSVIDLVAVTFLESELLWRLALVVGYLGRMVTFLDETTWETSNVTEKLMAFIHDFDLSMWRPNLTHIGEAFRWKYDMTLMDFEQNFGRYLMLLVTFSALTSTMMTLFVAWIFYRIVQWSANEERRAKKPQREHLPENLLIVRHEDCRKVGGDILVPLKGAIYGYRLPEDLSKGFEDEERARRKERAAKMERIRSRTPVVTDRGSRISLNKEDLEEDGTKGSSKTPPKAPPNSPSNQPEQSAQTRSESLEIPVKSTQTLDDLQNPFLNLNEGNNVIEEPNSNVRNEEEGGDAQNGQNGGAQAETLQEEPNPSPSNSSSSETSRHSMTLRNSGKKSGTTTPLTFVKSSSASGLGDNSSSKGAGSGLFSHFPVRPTKSACVKGQTPASTRPKPKGRPGTTFR